VPREVSDGADGSELTGDHGWLRALVGLSDRACGRPRHTLEHLLDPAAVLEKPCPPWELQAAVEQALAESEGAE
jgi:hypothetical protein